MARVLIAGGGLAGLSCALWLAERSAAAGPGARMPLEVVLVEAGRIGARGASAQACGAVVAGISPSPLSLEADLGPERLDAALRFGAACAVALRRRLESLGAAGGVVAGAAVRRVALGASEAARVERAAAEAARLRAAGLDARAQGGSVVAAADFAVDPAAALAALAGAARAAGVLIREDCALERVESRAEGVRGVLSAGEVEADRVVLALGAWLPALDSWLDAIALPVRLQSLAGRGPRGAPCAFAVGPGFALGVRAADGALRASEGAQAANRGDPFDAAPDTATQERLETSARKHLGAAGARAASDAWQVERRASFPGLFTCDGLPLIGPHPARADALLATGFCGHDWPLAYGAGRWIAEWILDGAVGAGGEDAATFSPRRMV